MTYTDTSVILRGMTFGERLAKELELCSMSQNDLAQRLGIQRQSITNWVKGYSRPSRDNLAQTEEVLGLRRGELLAMFDYRHPDEEPAEHITPEDAIRWDEGIATEDKRALLRIVAGMRRAFGRESIPTETRAGRFDDPDEQALWELEHLPEDVRWELIHHLRERRAAAS